MSEKNNDRSAPELALGFLIREASNQYSFERVWAGKRVHVLGEVWSLELQDENHSIGTLDLYSSEVNEWATADLCLDGSSYSEDLRKGDGLMISGICRWNGGRLHLDEARVIRLAKLDARSS